MNNTGRKPVRQKLVVILGPTSSGKTRLARMFCKEYGGYIISADSRQVYRYMDIGTGKVETEEELRQLKEQRSKLSYSGNDRFKSTNFGTRVLCFDDVSHYMIDVVDPLENYNVALYKREVDKILSEKRKAKSEKVPYIVGGTGQYIDAVIDNWQFPEGEPDLELRQKLEQRVKEEELESLWKELITKDVESAMFVQRQNPRRVIRALEYVLSTGKKISKERKKGNRQFDVLKIGITVPREELYKKIDARVDARLELGMVQEVLNLHNEHGLSWERLHQFGLEYRIIVEWLRTRRPPLIPPSEGGNSSGVVPLQKEGMRAVEYQDMVQKLKWAIHDYARRQLTWFRKDKEIYWVSSYEDAAEMVEKFFK